MKKIDPIEEILRDKTCGILFLSCLEKEKSVKDVSKEWNYSPTYFYRQETLNKLLNLNLIHVTRIFNKQVFLISDLNTYWDILEKILSTELPENHLSIEKTGILFLKKMLNDRDAFKNISKKLLKNKLLRTKLFNTKEIIKDFFRGKRRYINPLEYWLAPSLIFLLIIFTLAYFNVFLEKEKNIDEKRFNEWKNKYLKSFLPTLGVLQILLNSDETMITLTGKISDYWKYLFRVLNFDDISFLLEDIEKTKIFQDIKSTIKLLTERWGLIKDFLNLREKIVKGIEKLLEGR